MFGREMIIGSPRGLQFVHELGVLLLPAEREVDEADVGLDRGRHVVLDLGSEDAVRCGFLK